MKFDQTGGGDVVCGDCGHTWCVTSFLHGHGEELDCLTGYQCQTCGEFTTRRNTTAKRIDGDCKCGGDLSNEQDMFCPNCRSQKIGHAEPYFIFCT